MFGFKMPRRRGSKDQGEKPFWISFSDLMTALMVLFLVAMAVALMAVTQGLQQIKQTQELRDKTILACLADVEAVANLPQYDGVKVHGNSIDFGTLVQFKDREHTFEKPADERLIRSFVPKVLEVARAQQCKEWLKRVVVEGFASNTGDYLYNLNLSYLRSQRVLCALLNSQAPDALSESDRSQIQTLFLVGGSSFNTAASGGAARMRRVEIKLEFRDIGTKPEAPADIPLDPGRKCPND
jgi:outer membrane protein OmpA-like peptidoglycan-associated protein